MTEIPIFEKSGEIVDRVCVNDAVDFVSGRTSKGTSVYYKGLGSLYRGHAGNPTVHDIIVKDSSIFYYGSELYNPNWAEKFGIFREKYQPFFSDWIGSCGPKEDNIFKASIFSRSALRVIAKVEFDPVNKQSYYVLDYTSPRDSFFDGYNLKALVDLLKVLLDENWNMPWDKAAIRDVNSKGYVTDVADMFMSSQPEHQFGTIYSILYSLHEISVDSYVSLVKTLGLAYAGHGDIPFICQLLLSMYRVNIDIPKEISTKGDRYIHLVGNVLLRGRNCASVENIKQGTLVSREYIVRFVKQIPENKRFLVNEL